MLEALDLLENVEVHSIIIPRISNEELLLARLGDKVRVPLLSFSSLSALSRHPYFIQVSEDENYQFHAIATLIDAFRWRSFVFLYEDTADARQAQSYIHDIFQENHLDIAYQSAISLQATDDEIINELHKLMMVKASIFVVHLSPSLASQVFVSAKLLGMMSKGFAWIVTSKTMDFLDPQDYSVYESMQGVLGFKSYIPESNKLQNLKMRWRMEFQKNESNLEIRKLNIVGLRAYDATWLLAKAIENAGIQLSQYHAQVSGSKQLDLSRLRVSKSGPAILSKITSSKFTGLRGEFQFTNRKLAHETYEMLNVIQKVEIGVGFWTASNGFTKEIYPCDNSSSRILDTIIWPGFSLTAPQSSLVQMTGKNFRVGIPTKGRFHELINVNHDLQNNLTSVNGYCIDVFHAVLDRLPYRVSPEYIPFHNGSYNDLVYQVYLKTYDAAVGDITILSNRSTYVDFTLPFSDLGVGFIVKLDDKDPWFFLKPLSAGLWIMSACSFVLMGFIVWLIEHRTNEEFQGPPTQQIGALLWFAVSTLVYAHRERLRSNASRFVVGVWFFVVLILTSSYIANLSSLLTVSKFKLTKRDYIGYSANSVIRGMIVKDNLNFKDNRLKPYRSPEQYYEDLRKGSKNGGVGAIFEEVPYIKALVARYPDEFTMIESSQRTSGFGFALPKGSPLAHEMSRAIAELREEGELLEMEKKWFKSQSPFISQNNELPMLNPLTIDNFFGLFLVNGISEFIAILIFVIFLLHEKLSANFYFLTMLVSGKLKYILRYFYPRMDNISVGVDTS